MPWTGELTAGMDGSSVSFADSIADHSSASRSAARCIVFMGVSLSTFQHAVKAHASDHGGREPQGFGRSDAETGSRGTRARAGNSAADTEQGCTDQEVAADTATIEKMTRVGK